MITDGLTGLYYKSIDGEYTKIDCEKLLVNVLVACGARKVEVEGDV